MTIRATRQLGIKRYFESWWMPAAAILACSGIFLVFGIYVIFVLHPNASVVLAWLLVPFLCSLLAGAAAAGHQIATVSWKIGVLCLGLLSATAAISIPVINKLVVTTDAIAVYRRGFSYDTEIAAGIASERPKPISGENLGHGSTRQGPSSIHLHDNAWIPGYTIHAYVNPGENGQIYLKAFEATKNTPLDADYLPQSSRRSAAWLGNRETQYLYQSEFFVGEGGWNNSYPVRLELWFTPSSGGPERKLIEKTFLVSGWGIAS